MCTCESGMKKKRSTPLNLSVSVSPSLESQQQQQQHSRKRPRHSRCVRFAESNKSEEQERQPQPQSLLPNEDAVQTSAERDCSCLSLASILPAPLPAAAATSLQPLHPFVPANQWLQPWEQQLQRHEVLQELQQLSVDPEAEHFRDLYQSIYKVCHALADEASTTTIKNSHNNNETVLPKELVVICTQLLSSNSNFVGSAAVSDTTTTTTTTRRGLEDGLVPLVALARRLERRQTIRTVLALQKQPKVAAAVGRHLSRAHGTFAHALALGDAAAAQLIYNCDDNDNC